MIQCLICNNYFKNNKSLSWHVRTNHTITFKTYYDKYLKKTDEGICYCGKETSYKNMLIGYRQYCSHSCKSNDPLFKNKIKQTNLKKYGVKYPTQNTEVKNKIKQTNLERYGTEHTFENEEIKDKIRKTNLERYGCEYPIQNTEVKNKTKETNLEKYGVEYCIQSNVIKDKIKQTNLERYGVENVSQNEDIKEKIKENNLIKYGVEYPSQSKEFRNRVKQTSIKKYGVENVFQNEDIKEKIKQTMMEKYGVLYSFQLTNHDYTTSTDEKIVLDYIKLLYNGIILENDYSVLNDLELDIYLPALNLAIEYNGTYWHSELSGKDEYYHHNKYLKCKNLGITLLQIWEHNWHENKEYIKDVILYYINKNKEYETDYLDKIKNNNIVVNNLDFDHGEILIENGYKRLNKINVILKSEYKNLSFHNAGYDYYIKDNLYV